MNERIMKLAEQAGFDLGNVQPYKVENFAELIVRECMRMCEVAEVGLITHGLKEQSYGASNAKQYIIDWFGVEE
jgi:hypothetical protein